MRDGDRMSHNILFSFHNSSLDFIEKEHTSLLPHINHLASRLYYDKESIDSGVSSNKNFIGKKEINSITFFC